VAPGAAEGAAAADAPAAAAGGAAAPAGESGWTRDAAEFNDNWAAALDGLEQRQTQELTGAAVADVRKEYAQYIEAVDKAPRYLVGQRVPRADGQEGEEVLHDAQDARDWQEQIKIQLAKEVSRRVQQGQEANRTTMELLHNSIEVFRGNADITPGTKQFDKEVADSFVELIRPYAVKTNDGKTVGWSIDVKPLLEVARSRIAAQRAAAGAAAKPAEPTAQQQRAAAQQRDEAGKFSGHPADAPQAGIQSQAGSQGGEGENLDVLFGTLGIPAGTFRF